MHSVREMANSLHCSKAKKSAPPTHLFISRLVWQSNSATQRKRGRSFTPRIQEYVQSIALFERGNSGVSSSVFPTHEVTVNLEQCTSIYDIYHWVYPGCSTGCKQCARLALPCLALPLDFTRLPCVPLLT